MPVVSNGVIKVWGELPHVNQVLHTTGAQSSQWASYLVLSLGSFSITSSSRKILKIKTSPASSGRVMRRVSARGRQNAGHGSGLRRLPPHLPPRGGLGLRGRPAGFRGWLPRGFPAKPWESGNSLAQTQPGESCRLWILTPRLG